VIRNIGSVGHVILFYDLSHTSDIVEC
jgi:hypothetical protein